MDQELSSNALEDEEPPLSENIVPYFTIVGSLLQYVSYHSCTEDLDSEIMPSDQSLLEQISMEPFYTIPSFFQARRDFEEFSLQRCLDDSIRLDANPDDETADLLLYLQECEQDNTAQPADRTYFTESLESYRG